MAERRESIKLGVVVHSCNPSTWEAKAGGLRVPGQPGLQNDSLSLKKKKKSGEEGGRGGGREGRRKGREGKGREGGW
jgi:hypothetical protein